MVAPFKSTFSQIRLFSRVNKSIPDLAVVTHPFIDINKSRTPEGLFFFLIVAVL